MVRMRMFAALMILVSGVPAYAQQVDYNPCHC